MCDTYADYGRLLNRFVGGAISPEEFQRAYLTLFKNENRKLDEPLFELLDGLFGDVDAFTTDQELLSENPGFYLDGGTLIKKTAEVLKQLIRLRQKPYDGTAD